MIYDFNLKEVGPGFNIANLCDLPVVKVWNSNVSQKERYIFSRNDGTGYIDMNCGCKAFRNSLYLNTINWQGNVELQINGNEVSYLYTEFSGRGGEIR